MNSYELSRNFFDWCFDNPEKVNANHVAIYFFAVEHCNRLGWKQKFGFPSQMTMDALGIKKHQTYSKYFNELVEFGFFKLIEKSQNQYSANIISLVYAMPKKGKALGKAMVNHAAKQTESIGQSTGQSKGSIDKPITNNLITNKPINNNKISIRENVSLLQSEIDNLQSQYSEQELNWIYDKLSNYKLSTDKKYKSDYGAINTWVIDSMRKAKNEFIKDNNTGQVRTQVIKNISDSTDWEQFAKS